MPYAHVNGVNLHYDVYGQGQPLLFVNGLGQPSIAWEAELIQAMTKTHQVITFDNRGTGLSDKPDEPYTISMFASDAVALLDLLNIPRAHVFGVSMGGMIAQELGAHYPQRVASLILGCTTPGGRHAVQAPPESLKALQGRADMTPEEAGRQAWKLSFSDEFIQTHRAQLEENLKRTVTHVTPRFAYERHYQATMTLRVFKYLKDIKLPTLVVTGHDDILIPAANSEIIAKEIPGSELKIFDNVGHGFFISARDQLVSTMQEFLSRQSI